MKSKGRRIFFGLVVMLWLVVCVLGAAALLEFYPQYHQRSVERTNRFVLAYRGFGRWPDLDDAGNPVMPDETEVASVVEPPVETSPLFDHLGARFAQYSEEDRQTYAFLNEEVIAVYDRDGNNLGVYGTAEQAEALGVPAPAELAGKPLADTPLATGGRDALALIERVLESGLPESTAYDAQMAWGSALLEMHGYPIRNEAGEAAAVVVTLRNSTGLTLTEIKSREVQEVDSPMWLIPWVEYRKNARLSQKWSTNNVGFRDDDVILPKPAGVFRIACVGGSTTEEGFTNATTYPNILEQKLNDHFAGDPPVEVINCGVVGLDSLGEKRRALDFVRLEPDLIVEYNGVNDICHALLPMWQKEWERDATDRQRRLRRSRFVVTYLNHLFWPDDAAMVAQLERSTMNSLRTMWEVIEKRNIAMGLCSFAYPDIDNLSPEERDYYEWNVRTWWQGKYFNFATYCRLVRLYNQCVKALCEQEGLLYVPLAEELKGGPAYFGDICHMRPKGIERKAEILARHLKDYIESQRGQS